MNIFAIGDLHLSFSSDKPMDIYGGQWVNHTQRIEKNWRAIVEPEDVVILLGDTSWALKQEEAQADLAWIAALPGKKVLIKGNHDLWWTSVSKLNRFDSSMFFLQNSSYRVGDYAICGTRGWISPGDIDSTEHDLKIYRRELGRMKLSLEAGVKSGAESIIVAIHYPPTNGVGDESEFTNLFESYPVKKVFYGHLHGVDAQRHAFEGERNGIDYQLAACDHIACCPILVARQVQEDE